MIRKVKEIAANPLNAAKEEGREAQEQQDILEGKKKRKKRSSPFETQILEQTITKIGALLALGFGEGGAFLIQEGQYMNEESDINLGMKGLKVDGFFGFCDIR